MARRNKSGSFVFGIVLIAVGALLLLDQMHMLDFGRVIGTYWPLILVIIGIKIILFPKDKSEVEEKIETIIEESPEFKTSPDAQPIDNRSINENQVFGDIRRTISAKEFAGGRCSCVFGDIDIHAVDIKLGTGQRTLYLNSVFGDLRLTLPSDIPLLVRANTTAGDIDLKGVRGDGLFVQRTYKSADFDGASTRLIVVASVLFGDIRVW